MDWMNRDTRPNQDISQSVGHPSSQGGAHSQGRKVRSTGLIRAASITLLFSATLLIIALLLYTAFGNKPNNEGKYVNTSKFQAIFLNGGQVYFGHIRTLNNKYIRIDNIYYLRVNQTVQPNGQQQNSNPELVKLGCELHRPQDFMILNRDQVIFWENLKDDSSQASVPGAIKKYQADHPNAQSCDTTTQPTGTSTNKP